MRTVYDRLYSKPPYSRKASEPHRVSFWLIEETVGNGSYIILPGNWSTKVKAELNFPKGFGKFRAVEYQQGQGNEGPERV